MAALASGGCSIKKFAINKLGDSLANSGTTYAADDDPELIGQALPFSLKLVEGLLAESPEHRGLLLAAASGFTEYAYAYVNQDADMIEPESLEKLTALNISQAVICGLETHVCVNQTAHDLLGHGLEVHLLIDAVCSRSRVNKKAGLRKMFASGVVPSSVEMAVFELMRDAKHEQFKQIQDLIK